LSGCCHGWFPNRQEDGGDDKDVWVIYPPNIRRVQKFCLENATVSFGNTENQFNSRNRIKVGSSKKTIAISRDHQEQKLDIATAREMIPETTRARIDALTLRMGYVKEVL
jgi:hypothetical protein